MQKNPRQKFQSIKWRTKRKAHKQKLKRWLKRMKRQRKRESETGKNHEKFLICRERANEKIRYSEWCEWQSWDGFELISRHLISHARAKKKIEIHVQRMGCLLKFQQFEMMMALLSWHFFMWDVIYKLWIKPKLCLQIFLCIFLFVGITSTSVCDTDLTLTVENGM